MPESPALPIDAATLARNPGVKPGKLTLSAILLVTLLVQLALLFLSMPITAVLSGAHSFYIDNPYHVYQLELGKALLKQGQLLGFDPLLGAGHLGGMNDNVSARLPVFLAAVLPDSVPSGVVYSLYVLACALVSPLAVVWMARLLCWSPRHTAVAAAFGIALWWIGALHWYHTAGMASFVCGSFLGLPYAAWSWKVCTATTGRSMPGVIGAGILGGLGMWLHPLFPVLVGTLFLGFFIWDERPRRLQDVVGRGIGIATLALLVNAPWLLAMLGTSDIGANPLMVHPFQKSVGFMVALKPALGLWSANSMGSFLNPLMLLACASALFLAPPARRRVLPFLFAGLALLLFAAFGAVSVSLGQLQPNRFIAPAFLLIGLAAAYTVTEHGIALLRNDRRSARLLALGAAAAISLYAGREIVREALPGPHGHYGKAPPELSTTPPLVAQLEAWISANTTADARIVFETSLGRIHDGGHVAGLIALKTGREFVGAAYPYSLPAISFWDQVAFGRPIGEVSAAAMKQGFDLYNVGWVIAHSDALKRAMDGLPAAAVAAQFGSVRIYRIDRPLSYFHAGSGRIAARSFNRLDVEDASGPALILKYHWLPGLVTSPPTTIEPVQLVPGFPPFIRVLNPPSKFSVSLCTRCPVR
jgi:hypothetical protein